MRALPLTCIATVVVLVTVTIANAQDDPATIRWAVERAEGVSNMVFGTARNPEDLSPDVSRIVTARTSDDEEDSQFSLTTFRNGDLSLELIRVRPSLLTQVRRLYATHRDVSAEEIAKRITSERSTLTSTQYPALKSIAARFVKLRSPIAPENALMMDPRRYQLRVDAGSQHIHFSLLGPSSGASREPVIVWIEETLKVLLKRRASRDS